MANDERRTSSWATDAAVDLLNSSKLTSNASEKLEKLKQIEELFRGNTFNKDDDQESEAKDAMTVVLRPMFESIVTETDPRVRKFGCELSERVCVLLGENMSTLSSASSVSMSIFSAKDLCRNVLCASTKGIDGPGPGKMSGWVRADK